MICAVCQRLRVHLCWPGSNSWAFALFPVSHCLLWVKLCGFPHPHPFICSNLNPQDLRMWPDWEIGSLQTELVKMRSSGWVRTQCDWCPYECGHLDTTIVICTGTMPCKDWSCAATSQGTTSSWRKGCTWSFPGTFQGSVALMAHFEPRELWDNTCLLFKPPSFKAFYHSSPSKRITPFQL